MKFLITFVLVCLVTLSSSSQIATAFEDSTNLPSHSVRIIASVKSAEYDYMVIVVEHVLAYSRGLTATPLQGDELTVRLPGRNKPDNDSRIEVDLKESIDVGALPSSYIMLDFRTID